MPSRAVSHLTYKRLGQGSINEGRPLSRKWVLKVAISLGLCAPFKHAFPITTQPKSSRCTHGTSLGPLRDSWTLCRGGASLPMRSRMSASISMLGILWAIPLRWGRNPAYSGVGISSLLFGMASHSMIGGRLWCLLPSTDSMTRSMALLPLACVVPEQVLSVY